jgi:glycosyltransferase involved in cell wall biosynthesis
MKKNIVLFVLFILPIVAYLFFASGVNGFTTLPVVSPSVPDLGKWKSLHGEDVTLNGKITILGFAGADILKNRGNLFNLNEKVYQRYHTFKDLQFVMVCPLGTEKDIEKIIDALDEFTDVSQWHFVFTTPQEVKAYYTSLKLKGSLDGKAGTSMVYIVDKVRNLRGRKEVKEYKEGYDTFHPSDLSNEMIDDFKIILYEYRAALKKNHNATKQL